MSSAAVSSVFRDDAARAPSADDLVGLALTDSLRSTDVAVEDLVACVEALAAARGEFSPLVPSIQQSASCFSLGHPNINLLNVASRAHHLAARLGVWEHVHAELTTVSSAQDRLDEACYVARQYSRHRHNAAVNNAALFAAAVRVGHWRQLGRIARVVTLDDAMRVDLTTPGRIAFDVGCDVSLLRALARIPISDAVAAAVCIANPRAVAQ
jgi:hypothetical protein